MLEAAHRIAQGSRREGGRSRRADARREVLPLGAARRAGGAGTRAARSGVEQRRAQAARYREPRKLCRRPNSPRGCPPCSSKCRRISTHAAKQRLKSNTVLANSIEEVEAILTKVTAEKGGGKFVMAHLKDDPACDARMKEFKATVRCIPLADEYDGPGKCIVTGETVDRRVVIAKAY